MFSKELCFINKEINNSDDLNNCLNKICNFLNKELEGYDWVGYYFHNKNNKELDLIAFSGVPTPHTKISFGKGICGQTALSNNAIIVEDVSKESNYISCNINVKSEIVVPLFNNEINVGPVSYTHLTLPTKRIV